VKLVPHEADRRIDVLVGDQPFTSYAWPADVMKPVLYPVRTSRGTVITRGFPLDPRPDESRDHPHHVGLWFNYGDVAGVDFWGNTGANKSGRGGTIVHRSIQLAKEGPGRAELVVIAEWLMPDGKAALREDTRFVFAAADGRRTIDRIAVLTATGAAVPFNDNKEGMLGLRLSRALEQPGRRNQEGTGQYRTSEGLVGDAVWGTRARWTMLTGQAAAAEPVTVAVLDHPSNPGHPTYWHARGYGLFAANPLGQASFSKGKEKLGFTLAPGQPARFAYRVLILSRHAAPEEIDTEQRRFATELAR
jgi:hypothetical protein